MRESDPMEGVAVRASATVGINDAGHKNPHSNRVRVQKPNGRVIVARQSKSGNAADASVAGKPYVVISLSIPVEDLVALDADADAAHMSRSHYLRHAVRTLRGLAVAPKAPKAPKAAP